MNTPHNLSTDQEAAFEKLAERMADFYEEGVKRSGSPEAFLTALEWFNESQR